MATYPCEKRLYVCMVLFSLSFSLFADVFGGKFNYTNLIFKYFLVCGPEYLCQVDDFNFPSKPNQLYTDIGACPLCYCDEDCILRRDCCPDFYFALPFQTCVNVTLVQAAHINDRLQRSHHLMVNMCPESTDEELKRKCRGHELIEQFQNLPVTGNSRPLTYYNKFCAHCNGETNFTVWSLDFFCEKFSDFNFLSTFDEVITQAVDRQCVIQSFPEEMENKTQLCFDEVVKFYNVCNKTKLWTEFDFDIQYGCEMANFKMPFRLFQNVFCYICNPSYTQNFTIDQCNTTSIWYPSDKGLSESCGLYPTTTATFPYKNIFCYLCNRDNSITDPFVDVDGRITESITRLKQKNSANLKTLFLYQMHIDRFNEKYLSVIIREMLSQRPDLNYYILPPPHTKIFITKDGRKINFRKLLQKYMSFGEVRICDKDIIPSKMQKYVGRCDCSSACLFSQNLQSCCVDKALRYPGECISKSLSHFPENDMPEYFVTNGCYEEVVTSSLWKEGCEGNGIDIFSTLPLSDLNSKKLYLNLFCFMCNQYHMMILDNLSYDPWDIHVECDIYVDFQHFLLISDLINGLKSTPCRLEYMLTPDKSVHHHTSSSFNPRTCQKHAWNSVCNKTGLWRQLDKNVKWACEEVSKGSMKEWLGFVEWKNTFYKNEFCAICNPPWTENRTITTCNETGLMKSYDLVLDKACFDFPSIDYFSPYKNFFCACCNGATFSRVLSQNLKDNSLDYVSFPNRKLLPIYRNIFSPSSYDEVADIGTTETECATYQLYDKISKSCRNITCYPGKYRLNSTCLALLPRTSRLRYTFTVGFNGRVDDNVTTLQVMDALMVVITLELTHRLNLLITPVVDFFLEINQQCLFQTQVISSSGFTGMAYFSVFIQDVVQRVKTEETVLEFIFSNFTRFIDGISYHIQLFSSKEANYLPLRNSNFGFKKQCFQYKFVGPALSLIPYQQYRLVSTSQTLVCQQIELENNEFEVDYIQLQLRILKSGTTFESEEFDILPNGKARICVDIYNIYNDFSDFQKIYTIETILWISTLTCTIVSLFCLFITFATYSVFKVLRSVPGKTNMNLVVNLFITMLLYQVGIDKIQYRNICVGIGIALHFVWLTAFTSMHVCCFHMFNAFRGQYVKFVKMDKTFCLYCLYTYGVPAVIVITNVCTHAGMSSGNDLGYGGSKCFISGQTSVSVTFLTPLIIICFSNLFFFGLTIRTIKLTPKIRSNRADREDFLVFAKLFTVTGISWLLQILDAFLPISAFSFVVGIVNSLQGFFIFMAFVCNKRILSLYKSSFKRGKSGEGHTVTESTIDTSFTEASMDQQQ